MRRSSTGKEHQRVTAVQLHELGVVDETILVHIELLERRFEVIGERRIGVVHAPSEGKMIRKTAEDRGTYLQSSTNSFSSIVPERSTSKHSKQNLRISSFENMQ